MALKFKRILLKLSGEALAGEQGTGIDPQTMAQVCAEIGSLAVMDMQVAIVLGGGNVFRGLSGAARGMDRSRADYMGMLATVFNALALQDTLEKQGFSAFTLSAIKMPEICEPFIIRHALAHLDAGHLVICAGGTGNPYFTTDTAATLRGLELKCDAIVKATKVDGVYDRDPEKYPDAKKFGHVTYDEVLGRHLEVMDAAAIALARDNHMPIVVCRMLGGDIARVARGEYVGTIVEAS